jgi:hypothetical protein
MSNNNLTSHARGRRRRRRRRRRKKMEDESLGHRAKDVYPFGTESEKRSFTFPM